MYGIASSFPSRKKLGKPHEIELSMLGIQCVKDRVQGVVGVVQRVAGEYGYSGAGCQVGAL
jgi:hypothetical protein